MLVASEYRHQQALMCAYLHNFPTVGLLYVRLGSEVQRNGKTD
jgi:hypothetical protein